MRRNFSTPGPVQVYVELGAGHLRVEGAPGDEAVVEIHGSRAEDFIVEMRGRQLAVVAPRGRWFGHGDAHDVRVLVPEGSDLATKTGSADTETAGTLGTLTLKTGSGDVVIAQADGVVVVDSGSGDVRGERLGAEVRIKSGSGDIDLGEVRGTAGISTGSGDVVIGRAHGSTAVKTGSGDLEVHASEGNVTLMTASGDLTLGRVPRGKVTAKNVSGDVRVGIPAGTPVWTDINSVTGSVASDLGAVGKPADGQPYVELRASTVSGDVVLRQV